MKLSTKDGEIEVENILVVVIVALAAGLLGRNYYKKYKKGNACSCGCSDCAADTSACDLTEAQGKSIGDLRKKNQ